MARNAALILLTVFVLAFLTVELFVPRRVTSVQEAKEMTLRQDLVVMRDVVKQYVLDKKKRPQSFDDLVKAGYLKQIPPDPITGRNDTWVLEWSDDPTMPGIVNIRSGSHATSRKGDIHQDW